MVKLQEAVWLFHPNCARLSKCAQRWNMKCNLPKYKVMHLERIKGSVKYTLNGTELVTIRKKKGFEFW